MKGCLYTVGGLFAVFLIGNFVFWFKNGPGNPYDVARLKRDIATNVPTGSSKAQATTWLKAHGFTVYPCCFNASHNNRDLLGRRDYTRSEIVCSCDVIVSFAFDSKHRLIGSGVRELETCL